MKFKARNRFFVLLGLAVLAAAGSSRLGFAAGGGFYADDARRGIGNLQTNIVDVFDSTTGYKMRLTTGVLAADGTFSLARVGQERVVTTSPKVGTTAGFVVNAANNIYLATVPQSQTASTLVIPIDGLNVGDTITGVKLNGCYTSAGNTVTVDLNLRSQTAASGSVTDASIASATQLSVTANGTLALAKTGISSVVATAKSYYLLVTVTTGASCTVSVLGASVTVTKA
jgi:hypothetical protein